MSFITLFFMALFLIAAVIFGVAGQAAGSTNEMPREREQREREAQDAWLEEKLESEQRQAHRATDPWAH